jgi:hypothetical protein
MNGDQDGSPKLVDYTIRSNPGMDGLLDAPKLLEEQIVNAIGVD